MKEYDNKARKLLEGTNDYQEDKNKEKIGNKCMMLNDEILDRPMKEAVRKMDAMESENGCLSEKSGKKYNVEDTEARNAFANGLSAAALKCSTGLIESM